jgi:hypothetical protein
MEKCASSDNPSRDLGWLRSSWSSTCPTYIDLYQDSKGGFVPNANALEVTKLVFSSIIIWLAPVAQYRWSRSDERPSESFRPKPLAAVPRGLQATVRVQRAAAPWSWGHGSIGRRIAFLESLEGTPRAVRCRNNGQEDRLAPSRSISFLTSSVRRRVIALPSRKMRKARPSKAIYQGIRILLAASCHLPGNFRTIRRCRVPF